MKQTLKMGDRMDAEIIHGAFSLGEAFKLGTIWEWEQWRNGKLISQWFERNLCTDQGITHVIDVAFSGGTQITAWYVVLFEDNHSPAAGDTYAVPGYTESSAYDEATRPSWQEAGVASKAITNSANKATFTMNATKTIYGAALVGGGTAPSTKGDTAGGGKLFCVSQFASGSKPVVDDDILRVTITLTGADA